MIKKMRTNCTKICRDALKIMLSIKDGAHNVEHIVRVYDWSRELAENYPETDLKVLKVAAYWHDVGRKYEIKKVDDHNIKSGKMVEKYLQKAGFPKEFVDKVKDAVVNHSFSLSPKTIEGKIVHDADKLTFLPFYSIADAYYSMKEGYETKCFNRKNLVGALQLWFKNTEVLYNGLILKESKELYRDLKDEFLSSIKLIINDFSNNGSKGV